MRVRIEAENVDKVSKAYHGGQHYYKVHGPGGVIHTIPAEWCTEIPPEIPRGTMVWAWDGGSPRVVVFYVEPFPGGKHLAGPREDGSGLYTPWDRVRPVSPDDLGGE